MKKQQKKIIYKPTTKFKYSLIMLKHNKVTTAKLPKNMQTCVDKLDNDNFDKGKKRRNQG